jgi:hypothetical protein
MPTLTDKQTALLTSGRKKNVIFPTETGDFWKAIESLSDAEYNQFVIDYNALEDGIDADPTTLGTRSDGSTFVIGASTDRPQVTTR